jgi:hypothetical protein
MLDCKLFFPIDNYIFDFQLSTGAGLRLRHYSAAGYFLSRATYPPMPLTVTVPIAYKIGGTLASCFHGMCAALAGTFFAFSHNFLRC